MGDTVANTSTQNDKFEYDYDCFICYNKFTSTDNKRGHKCRQCAKVVCDDCMLHHMKSSLERKIQYRKDPILECPFCRTNWFVPKFFLEAEGRPYTEDVSCRLHILGRDQCFLHGIHDGNKFVGYVCVKHTLDWYEKEHSFHVKDLEKLEKYAKPLDSVVFDSKKRPFCVLSTEDDLEHMKVQFSTAGVECVQITDSHIATPALHDFIAASVNLF